MQNGVNTYLPNDRYSKQNCLIMKFTVFVCGVLFYLYCQINECFSKMASVTYLNMEHPVVEWYDRRYGKNFTFQSRRIRRQDPRHYVEIYIHALIPLDNSWSLDFYFYQFLSNRYRPSFVEMHFKLCDMVNSNSWFGPELRKAVGGRRCPYPAGKYDLKNLTIPYVPKNFPFTKGRIFLNVSLTTLNGVTEHIGRGSIDMELKVAKIDKN